MSAQSIYSITNEIQDFLLNAEKEGWDDQTIADTLMGLEGPLEDKVDNYLKVIANKEAVEAALKAEATTLNERSKVFGNESKRMKGALLEMLNKLDKQNIKAPHGTIAKLKGRESVKVDNDKIDEKYWVFDTVKTLNKQQIKADLENDITVEGAWIETSPESLSIRRK